MPKKSVRQYCKQTKRLIKLPEPVPLNFPPFIMPFNIAGWGEVGIRVGPGDKSYPYPDLLPSRLFPSMAACSSCGELKCSFSHS